MHFYQEANTWSASKLSTISDNDLLTSSTTLRTIGLNLLHHIHTVHD